ncbi:MAG: Beta-galactosidase Arabinogalactan endo,4-beta-galactosidase [Flavisolibacter sp.]|jgi:beta-galactosidase|nr:Beta-galactosidase Arabinogalactan endo,4-beta-galactosidase [Flavisolibacter sp.]
MQAYRAYLFIIAVLFSFSFCYGQTSFRKKTNIDDNWKFRFGHAANPEKDFNYSIATIFSKSGGSARTAADARFNDSAWTTLNLPHDWAVELPFANVDNFDVESHGYKPVGGLFPATSIGWYRKHFTVASADSGQRFQIQFDGIFRDANIWINGFYLGNNKSGYIGASYDVTDFVRFDKDNVIVVRADASQYEGWFYEGAGIYRHVWLNQYDNLHIPDGGLFTYAEVQNKAASVTIETTVENQNFSGANCTVYSYITDRNGKQIAQTKEQPLALSVNGKGIVKQKITVNNPRLWSLDDPYLYRVISVVKSGGKVVDIAKDKFGIRTLRFDAKEGFFLNGKHVKIYGTNNHQDHAGVGSALPDYLQYYRVRLLKNMGANAYRTSHNPPTPELLEACDSLGMLVMDETRLLSSSAEYMDQFERMILRDRNHPSIFMWSIGNEEGWVHTTSNGKRIAQTLLAKQKELDPSRTSTYAADLANVFPGVNEVIPIRGFNYRQFAVADYHRDHPGQPILGTEMGSTVTTRGVYTKDSIRAYLPDQDITAPWWASTAETWWKLAGENPYWMGGFVWTGFDYRGEPTPYKWPNINSHFGIMDVCGFPKNIYYYYQSWWTDKDVLHISPHWNWKDKRNQPIDVWVNTNADNVELFLNGKSLGKKDMPRNSHLQWAVNYQPGVLEAVAYKKGKKLTAKVETTGTPTEVVMTPYKTTMLADGKDVSVINLSVVDQQGREVPDANNMIQFVISGPGKIIGVGNGDPSSHEPDKCTDGAWQRSLFNGKAQVLVQSTGAVGIIKFEAKAAGLFTGSTDIITVSPGSVSTVSIDKNYELKGEAAKPREATKMVGADISFLPQLEDRGVKFSDKGVQKDAIEILKDHGFNYVRLRIFNDPARDSGGYSPKRGFCDLAHTKQMAKRVKAAGMKLLLDFHYSDTWADPGKQYKPAAWKNLSFTDLKKALYDYTKQVMQELEDQGTTPDMVQVGNEINHGMVWPEGSVNNVDSMTQLIAAGIAAVKAVDPAVVIMIHVALGGQNDETVFFMDQMMARKVSFDVMGLSYYPKWHGTLDDLRDNMNDLLRRYNKDIIVVEYSAKKQEVNKLAFELPGGKGKGACIWEPLSTWEKVFDSDGKSNDLIKVYDEISKSFITTD